MLILVVDDSMVARNILKNVLEPMGHEVIEASNGREALKILEKLAKEVGCVLLDWNMPVMNGFETLQAIRSDKDCGHILILMVSTESEDEFIERAIAAGANGYLAKPFSAEELKAKMADILKAAKPR
ncbi:MAG: hypothetical protein VR64_18465 [Desulfatitalea sp. BRH_c12]|nr:MAG: hypothetical protein VR64_18465 [Desulfatitalea sp. BRH_c12]